MTDKPEYQFKFQIIDKTTGDVIGEDWTYLTTIDTDGSCDSVNIHVGSTLRWFNRTGRAEHEAANYPDNDKQLVTQTAERIRAVVANDAA